MSKADRKSQEALQRQEILRRACRTQRHRTRHTWPCAYCGLELRKSRSKPISFLDDRSTPIGRVCRPACPQKPFAKENG